MQTNTQMRTNQQEYLQALKKEVSKKMPNITFQEITFSSPSMAIRDLDMGTAVSQLTNSINDVFEVYFGKDRTRVPQSLKTAIIRYILDRYSMLTVQDVQFAFERIEIEQNQYQSITVQSFCRYIQMWYAAKLCIWQAKKDIRLRMEQQKDLQDEQMKYKNACIQKYREHLNTNQIEWNGNIFESNVIAKDLVKFIESAEIESLQKAAKTQHSNIVSVYEAKRGSKKSEFTKVGDESNDLLDMLRQTEERIFSKLVVEYCLFNEVGL